eukprot:g4000.t1
MITSKEDFEYHGGTGIKKKASMSAEALQELKRRSYQHQLQLMHRNRYTNLQCAFHFFITIGILLFGALCFVAIESTGEKDNAIVSYKQMIHVNTYLEKANIAWKNYDSNLGVSSDSFKSQAVFDVQWCNAGQESTVHSQLGQLCPAYAQKEKYVGMIPDHVKNQIDGLISGDISGSDVRAMNWELTSSIFFIMTIISTIGYGTFAPSTDGGKAFVALFAFIGIGYFGYTLTLVSDRFLIYVQRYAKKRATRKMNDEEKHYWFLPKWKQMIILSTLCVLYILFWSLFGPVIMEWTYLQSVYFGLVTFSTIGFGDYAPSFDPDRPGWFRAMGYFGFAVLTMIGLAFLSALLGAFSEFMEELDFRAKRKARAEKARLKAQMKNITTATVAPLSQLSHVQLPSSLHSMPSLHRSNSKKTVA